MKLTGSIVGRIFGDPDSLVSKAGRPFVAFTVVSKSEGDKFPTYVKCAVFTDKPPTIKNGDLVVVFGDITADGYLSKKDNLPRASLKMFCRCVDVIAEDAPKMQEQPKPKSDKPSIETDDESVPF